MLYNQDEFQGFLDASLYLYKWVCLSVRPSMHLFVSPSHLFKKPQYQENGKQLNFNSDKKQKKYEMNMKKVNNEDENEDENVTQCWGRIVGLLALFSTKKDARKRCGIMRKMEVFYMERNKDYITSIWKVEQWGYKNS